MERIPKPLKTKCTFLLDLVVDWIQQFVMGGLITVFVLMILKRWGCFGD